MSLSKTKKLKPVLKLSKNKKIKKDSTPKQNNGGNNHISVWAKFLTLLQNLGKSLLFPIATLPAVAIFLRIGSWLSSPAITHGHYDFAYWLGNIMFVPANIVFSNLGILFCVGLAFGLSKDQRGEAALAGFIGIVAFTALIGGFPALNNDNSTHSLSQLFYGQHVFDSFGKVGINTVMNTGVFGGVVMGCWTAWIYNRYSNVELHPYLAFFSGRRFVPMLIFFSTVLWAILFSVVWVWIQKGVYAFGTWLGDHSHTPSGRNTALAAVIAAIYGLVNRLLLPFGIHNVLNAVLWFQLPITNPQTGAITNGDIYAFAKGVPGSGIFQTGYFVPMMFGLPAAAAAMIMTSEKANRKSTAGLLVGAGVVSFLTGVTEPVEFAFLYAAPLLYGVHAVLTAIAAFVVTIIDLHIGFGFSAGLFDYIISYPNAVKLSMGGGKAWAPLLMFPIGIGFGVIYYFTFAFLIKKFNLSTPGRNGNILGSNQNNVSKKDAKTSSDKSKDDVNDSPMARNSVTIVKNLGGKENIESMTNCLTRIRVRVKNPDKVQVEKLKKIPKVYGVSRPTKLDIQVIVGQTAELYVDHIKKYLLK